MNRIQDQTSGPSSYPARVLFIFLDGVGLGDPEAASNPFAHLSLPALERLAGHQPWTRVAEPFCRAGHTFRSIDATLGVPGLPQSGTGQAALFTGVNCAAIAGRHFGPYPHSKTRATLAAHNVFKQVIDLGLPHSDPVAFANAYPPPFFAVHRQRDRWTVTTRCCLDAGVPIRDEAAFHRGDALAADLTGNGWKTFLGIDLLPITEEEAARRLLDVAGRHVFTLFEYYLTDKAGHSQSPDQADRILTALDRFLDALQRDLPPDTLLVVTSDHGNLEDLSTRGHTYHPVPLIVYGPGAAYFCEAANLTSVTPAIIAALRRLIPDPLDKPGEGRHGSPP